MPVPCAHRTVSRLPVCLAIALLPAFAGALAAAPTTNSGAGSAENPPGQTVTSPPAPMLAKHWQSGLDPSDYLVSEKLDGVRALWDGQTLYFRSGRTIQAPTWFTAGLPPVALDGELWIARRNFDRLSGIVRQSVPSDADWQLVRYMVFDMPNLPKPFAERARQLASLVAERAVPWLEALNQTRVADAAQLRTRLAAVDAEGGEGLMLHHARGLWHSGRSDMLRKLKPMPDEEGVVLAHVPGKGQFQGQMGALRIRAPNGQVFTLGSGFSQAERGQAPPVGSVVTYRYRGYTPAGLPRFASFVRLRESE